jgi:branched-chain amino acid transport system ATP-binding protein
MLVAPLTLFCGCDLLVNQNAQKNAHLSRPQPALEIQGLHLTLGLNHVVCDVSLALQAGERVAVIGPNGAGKTSLFNLISGRIQPSRGRVYLHGQRINGLQPFEIYRQGLTRSFQITQVFAGLSVFENLRCSVLWSLGHGHAFWKFLNRMTGANQRAEQLLHQLQLEHQRNTLAAQLTYAEQRALELGMTLAGHANVVLLDEPTAGMSQSETLRCTQLICRLTQGKTLLMVEHDMSVVFELADKVVVLVNGAVLAFDTPQAVRADASVQRAYLGAAFG